MVESLRSSLGLLLGIGIGFGLGIRCGLGLLASWPGGVEPKQKLEFKPKLEGKLKHHPDARPKLKPNAHYHEFNPELWRKAKHNPRPLRSASASAHA